MTQLRTPYTFADAMTRVAGAIGWDECRRIAGNVSDRTVRAWSEPKTDKRPRIDRALRLDAAYRAAGGQGSPFLEAFAFQLDVTIERQEACRSALAAQIGELFAEFGEAMRDALKLTQSGASPRDAHRAIAEVQQVDMLVDALLRRLDSFLTTGAGPVAEPLGVNQ